MSYDAGPGVSGVSQNDYLNLLSFVNDILADGLFPFAANFI